MSIKRLMPKVLKKLKGSLASSVKKRLPRLIQIVKESKADEINEKLMTFKNENTLSDAQFGEVMNLVIDAKVFITSDNMRDEGKIKELKKITDHPSVKIYFDRTY